MNVPFRTVAASIRGLLALLLGACSSDAAMDQSRDPSEGLEPASEAGAASDAHDDAASDRGTREADAAKPPAREGGQRDASRPEVPPAAKPDASAPGDGATPPFDGADATSGPTDSGAPSDAPAPCPAMKLSAGNREGKVAVGGHDRSYLLYVPKGYTGEKPIPLIFDFHGYGQSVTSQKGASGFATLADQHGFAVVYPAGVGGSWHVNGCCGQAAQAKLDEVAVVRAQLEQIGTQLCVDKKRVYASGISQGGGMAHHVGCLAADVFAAVAPVSSDLRTEPCKPTRPISELSFRGMADTLSAYEGGPVGPTGMQYQSIGARATLERWKDINMCSGAVEKTHELCETYKQCAGGVEVTLCTLPRGGHALYNNPERLNLAEFAWAMFARQRLP